MLNYAIFDLDGTILDTFNLWHEVDVGFLKKHSLGDEERYFDEILGMNFMQCALYTIEKYHLDRTPRSLMDEWDEMAAEAYENTVEAKPGAIEFLHKLHERGVRLGVATSNYEKLYKPALVRLGIYDLFESFTEAHDSKNGKSTPEIYLTEAQKLGATPECCAVFEDIILGVRSANCAGFTTFAILDARLTDDENALRKEASHFTYDYQDIDLSLFGRTI